MVNTLISLAQGKGQREIVNALETASPVLKMIPTFEATHKDHNIVDLVEKLGTFHWRRFNIGVGTSEVEFSQFKEYLAMGEAYSSIDHRMLDRAPDPSVFMVRRARTQIMGMGQKLIHSFWYGNTIQDPEGILGMSLRYGDKTDPKVKTQIVDAGGSGNKLRSIWILGLPLNNNDQVGCNLLYPQGALGGSTDADADPSGLIRVTMDGDGLGKTQDKDTNGNEMTVFKTKYETDIGLSVPDYRYNSRIANIDYATLKADPGSSDTNLIELLDEALDNIYDLGACKPIIVTTKEVLTKIKQQARNFKTAALSIEQIANTRVNSWDGVPIYIDYMLTNETKVS